MQVRARKPRRKFSSRFKLEAVKRVIEGKETVTGVARDLGINRSTLSRWKRELVQSLLATAPQPWVSVVFEFADNAAEQPHWPPSSEQPEVTFEAQTVLAPGLGQLAHPGDAPQPANAIQAPSPAERGSWLGPREHSMLRAALRGESEPPDWPVLLAEGVAVQRKRLSEIRRLQDDGSVMGDVAGIFDELVGDAIIGLSLVKDTQQAIDRMIHSGQMTLAKQLTSFRSEIRRGLSEIIDRVGTDAFREAQAEAEVINRDEEQDKPVYRTVAPGARVTRLRRRARRSRRSVRPVQARNRTKPLLPLLAASLLLWLGVHLPRLQQQSLPLLSLEDFGQVSGISELTARPPSLFVELDAGFWDEVSLDQRRIMIQRIGMTARNAGYRGVHCTDGQGEPLAQWLRNGGVQLLGAGDPPRVQQAVKWASVRSGHDGEESEDAHVATADGARLRRRR